MRAQPRNDRASAWRGAGTPAGERGQTLILFTAALAILIGFAGLTIDVGQLVHERQARQNAADAAALAGASELPADPDAAVEEARDYAFKHGFSESDIDSIDVSTTHVTNDTIYVKLKSPYKWGFASVLSMLDITVSGDATAQIGSPASTAGLSPWGVKESAIDWSGGNTVLKYDSNQPTTGNFGPLAIDGTGSAIYEATIKYGSDISLCAQSQPDCTSPTATTETGNKVGGTRDGVQYMMSHTSSACDSFNEVLESRDDGTYSIRGRCNPWLGASDSHRLVLVPVISSLCNGRCTVTIKYFAVFFLNTLDSCSGNNCQVTGRFARVIANPNTMLGAYNPNNVITAVHLTS